jgi:uncharacterized protein YceK
MKSLKKNLLFLVCPTALLLFAVVTLLSGCASIAAPKPITIACSKYTKPEFTSKVADILKTNGYSVVSQDSVQGEIRGFRQQKYVDFGEHTILTGPFTMQLNYDAGSAVVLIYSVREDNKTPVKSWDETATDGYEKANYMNVMTALRALCSSAQ